MKRSLLIIITFAVTFFAACKKDNMVANVKSTADAAAISSPADGATITVTADDTTQNYKLAWSKANYGVQTVVTYFVQLSTASTFSPAYNLSVTTSDSLVVTLGTLNRIAMNNLNLPANAASDVYLRVGSTLNNHDTTISKVVKLNITTYKELAPPKLYVPGAYQGWVPANAPTIPLVDNMQYEGYVYMSTGDYFKFTSAPDWDHINYGDAGGGKLTTDGLAGGLQESAAGYYKFNVDIKNLTWSGVLIQSFGVIGTATPGQWDNSTAMTYDVTKGTWSVKVHLTPGALKFRANNAWDVNYGPADSNALSGTLIQTDAAITIVDDATYTVTIDMSQSTQKKYLYTVVKN